MRTVPVTISMFCLLAGFPGARIIGQTLSIVPGPFVPLPGASILVAGAQLRSGLVCVADLDSADVNCLDPRSLKWKQIARSGEGPGEFRAPYRLASREDGGLWVIDFQTQSISGFDAALHYEGRGALPFRFRTIDNILDLGGGTVALAGVPSISGESRSYAVHLFQWNPDRRIFDHLRSFGELPPANDREKIDYWGAGLISRTQDGTLLFSRRVPYRIEEWREDGTFVRAIDGPVKLTVGPDQGIIIEEGNGGISIRQDRDAGTVYPLQALPFHGQLLTGRRGLRKYLTWDLLNADSGAPLDSLRMPESLTGFGLVSVDPASGTAWGIDEVNDEPGVRRITFRVRRSM